MNPRRLAVLALMRQEQSGYANLVLDAELKKCSPPPEKRDAAFAARIFYTTLERQNLLDWLLGRCTKRPLQRLDAPVRAVLRSGLAQARFMQVPVPAAVNESVKLTRAMGKSSAAGMVNAVLRRAASLPVGEDDFAAPLQRLQIYYSLSAPVARLLYAQYGADAAALAAAFYRPQRTALRCNPLAAADGALIDALAAQGCAAAPGPWPHSLLAEFSGSPASCAAFRDGQFHVQGLASQYAALCVGARPGQRVLDLCAAPGGKSLTMAEEMRNQGELVSAEYVPARLPLLQKAFARCGIACARIVQNDAAVFRPEWQGRFDRVLCDVPCSGLGVIAKKPDVRYKTLDGLDELRATQQKILQNGARYLAQNGRLVYSTCTVNRDENEAQIRAFLEKNPKFRVEKPDLALPGAETTEYGTLLLPHKTGTDGFFIAILVRENPTEKP